MILVTVVHTNPGTSISYHCVCEKVSQQPENVKFFYLNVQTLTNNLSLVNFLVIDNGVKTILGFRQSNGQNVWSFAASKSKCHRCDTSTTHKKNKKWWRFMLVPNLLVSRQKREFNTFSWHLFNSFETNSK